MRPSTPAAQPKVGWKLGEDPFLPGGLTPPPLHWNWRQGTWERRAGACEETGTALMALSPAPCRQELPGPTHGGGAEVFFIYVYIFFF